MSHTKLKGAISGLPVLLIVAGFIIAVFLLFQYIGFLKLILNIKGQVDIIVDIEDKGTAFVSFLNSGKKINYMEVLGDLNATNYEENTELMGYINDVGNTLDKIESRLIVYGKDSENRGIELKKWGEISGDTVCVDIALPGRKKGEVCTK